MNAKDRLEQINNAIQAMQPGWPYVAAEINDRLHSLTEQLIGQESEQTRGRIKALRELLELPETLQQEREGIRAELPETDSAE